MTILKKWINKSTLQGIQRCEKKRFFFVMMEFGLKKEKIAKKLDLKLINC